MSNIPHILCRVCYVTAIRRATHMDVTVLHEGRYRVNKDFTYTSPRYGKSVTVKAGEYDGATGAIDIMSTSWPVHDQLCNTGHWDDGTKISNWECSTVLHDILAEEGRWARAQYWRVATWLFGGGEARKNGMIYVANTAT